MPAGPAPAASSSTPRRSPFVDVTAVRMLDELAADLARDGQQLVIAHDLGQVGDLLALADEQSPLKVVPTIDEAIEAIEASP